MKLNSLKFIFREPIKKFLGFHVSSEGISMNLEKIEAIIKITPLTSVKKVGSLTRKLSVLNQFIARPKEKCAQFFRTLYKDNEFYWDEDFNEAFIEIKMYLTKPLLLGSLTLGELLLLYLAVHLTLVRIVFVK